MKQVFRVFWGCTLAVALALTGCGRGGAPGSSGAGSMSGSGSGAMSGGTAGQEQAWRTGLGVVTEAAGSDRAGKITTAAAAVVLDADGINALSEHIDVLKERRGRVTILTPHDGEFARLGGDLSSGDRLAAARAFATEYGCTLVLKGHRTLTAAPAGTVLVNTTGGSGLAKGGSGDVLTGVIASLMAQRADALRAAAVGVWLHGRAGDLAEQELTAYSVTPEDVVRKLPDAIREILE